jgi:hypothetical protein
MTAGRIFDEREHAMEANYFRQQDAKLIEKLRQNAMLDEIAVALRDKLEIDNPQLLLRARELGITADTAAAFFLAPLVQVAWAGTPAGKDEREAVLRLARTRGIEETSPAFAQLVDWLKAKPADALFDTAIETIKSGFGVLPPVEAEERIEALVRACRAVAAASGSVAVQVIELGRAGEASSAKSAMVQTIAAKLRGR